MASTLKTQPMFTMVQFNAAVDASVSDSVATTPQIMKPMINAPATPTTNRSIP